MALLLLTSNAHRSIALSPRAASDFAKPELTQEQLSRAIQDTEVAMVELAKAQHVLEEEVVKKIEMGPAGLAQLSPARMAQLQAQVHDATQTYQERVSRLPPESRASVEKRLHGKVDHTLEEVDAAEVTVEEMKERLARQDAEMQELRAKYDTLVASRDGTGTVSPTSAAVADVVAEALSSAVADSAEPEPVPEEPARMSRAGLSAKLEFARSLCLEPEPEPDGGNEQTDTGAASPVRVRYKAVAPCVIRKAADKSSETVGELQVGEVIKVLSTHEGPRVHEGRVCVCVEFDRGWTNVTADNGEALLELVTGGDEVEPELEPEPEPEPEPTSSESAAIEQLLRRVERLEGRATQAQPEPQPQTELEAQPAAQPQTELEQDPELSAQQTMDAADIDGLHRMVKVHTAWQAPDDSQLSLAVGDLIAVTAVKDKGWCEGWNMADTAHRTGFFPSSFTQEVMLQPKRASAITPPPDLELEVAQDAEQDAPAADDTDSPEPTRNLHTVLAAELPPQEQTRALNLHSRFPTASGTEVSDALRDAEGHGGKAKKILAQRHSECSAPLSPELEPAEALSAGGSVASQEEEDARIPQRKTAAEEEALRREALRREVQRREALRQEAAAQAVAAQVEEAQSPTLALIRRHRNGEMTEAELRAQMYAVHSGEEVGGKPAPKQRKKKRKPRRKGASPRKSASPRTAVSEGIPPRWLQTE